MELCERAFSPVVSIPQAEPRKIAGWNLDRRYPPKSPTEAALLAVDLVAGVPLEPLTRAQALSVTGASGYYFSLARSLSPTERAMVEAGEMTLSGVVKYRRQLATEIAKVA
jgi:hypothetical protein